MILKNVKNECNNNGGFLSKYYYCKMIQTIAPYFGYLASLLLIIALLVNNDLKFRWFNTAGNVAFIIYALIFNAVPVLITNSILLVINAYYLVKVYSASEKFDLIEFKGEEKLVTQFLDYYAKDIHSYFPDFKKEEMKDNLNFVVLRNLVIANMFSASIRENGNAEVLINYTLKKFRDYKVGRFIFEKEKSFLTVKGVKQIVYKRIHNKNHLSFLKVMGFEKNNSSQWVKML